MKITDALRQDNSLRVVNGDKWLIFDKFNNEWMVFEKKKRKHHSIELARTVSEEMAVDVLMRET
jgi:hypothetical protein